MGVAASQARLHTILKQKIDVEYQLEKLSEQEHTLISAAQGQGGNNPVLKEQEKMLQNQIRNLETRQKALETEYESVKALITKNTQTSFQWYKS
ncbi:MAG: hypothetical protein V2B14_03740 [bacterium]